MTNTKGVNVITYLDECRIASQQAAEAMAEAKAKGPGLGWNVSLEQMLAASAAISNASEQS